MQSSLIWPACSPNIPRCLLVNSLKYVVAYFVSTGALRIKSIGGLSWINKKISSIMRNILQPDPMWSEERNGVMVLYQIYTNWNGWKYDSEALVNSNGLKLNSNTKTKALKWIGNNALMSLIVTWIILNIDLFSKKFIKVTTEWLIVARIIEKKNLFVVSQINFTFQQMIFCTLACLNCVWSGYEIKSNLILRLKI